MTLGHFHMDNTTLIGRMAGFNMWSRCLTEEEGKEYSGCGKYTLVPGGDLINDTVGFNITGGLIKAVTVDPEDTLCSHANPMNTLFLHSPFKRLTDAKETCNKYLMDSMTRPFRELNGDWKEFHRRGASNPAVREHCWAGGRILLWQYYQHFGHPQAKGYHFVHVGTRKALQIQPWQLTEPQGSLHEDLCVFSYHGLQYNASWYVDQCVQPWQWASCGACWLPNTIDEGVMITLRGLCEQTRFDTEYQVGRIAIS